MSSQPDYSLLDRPEILGAVFYPRQDWAPAPAGARDYMVPVEGDVSISCRFYPGPAAGPSVLYFHGNGEVACDYDGIAPLYNRLGIGLFVADFRGYGRSGGKPSFSAMSTDAHKILSFFRETVAAGDSSTRLFVMGRSLGAHAAVELASQQSEHLSGLIIESGAPNAARMAHRFGLSSDGLDALAQALSARIQSIALPALVIHGAEDTLIPVDAGVALHEELGSHEKELVIIPGAGHNDIMMVGAEQYFSAIEKFVFPDGGAVKERGGA